MSDEKTIYICNGTRLGVAVTENCRGGSTLSVDHSGNATISLMPLSVPPLTVDIKLLKDGDSVNSVMPKLEWQMVADSINGEPPYWAEGVRIKSRIPMACDWKETRIKSAFNSLPVLTQAPLSRPIPDSKTDLLPDDQAEVITSYLVPGEDIWIENEYSLTDSNVSSHNYWRTIAMTGGTIINKWPHATIENLFQYDINANGTVYNDLLPTDFYQYGIGDYVYILTLTSVAVIQDRTILTPDIPGTSDQLRIAPYTISGKGQLPSLKSYYSSDFVRWANMRILYGIIQSIKGDLPGDHSGKTNFATIELAQTGEILSDVPIKYWCQENSTDKSCHAFDPGNVVLVAFDGYRESASSFNCMIIGHAASVYKCTTTTSTTTTTTSTSTTVLETTQPFNPYDPNTYPQRSDESIITNTEPTFKEYVVAYGHDEAWSPSTYHLNNWFSFEPQWDAPPFEWTHTPVDLIGMGAGIWSYTVYSVWDPSLGREVVRIFSTAQIDVISATPTFASVDITDPNDQSGTKYYKYVMNVPVIRYTFKLYDEVTHQAYSWDKPAYLMRPLTGPVLDGDGYYRWIQIGTSAPSTYIGDTSTEIDYKMIS